MNVSYQGKDPEIHRTAFIAAGAVIIGDVKIANECSIWFNAVLRGDIHSIVLGEQTNIQDLSVLHVTKRNPVTIGSRVTVGHGAIVHGATIEDSCLVGMGAILLDGVHVGSHSLVAAGSLLREGFTVPEGTMVAGVPAVIRKKLSTEEMKRIEQSAENYVNYARGYRE